MQSFEEKKKQSCFSIICYLYFSSWNFIPNDYLFSCNKRREIWSKCLNFGTCIENKFNDPLKCMLLLIFLVFLGIFNIRIEHVLIALEKQANPDQNFGAIKSK